LYGTFISKNGNVAENRYSIERHPRRKLGEEVVLPGILDDCGRSLFHGAKVRTFD